MNLVAPTGSGMALSDYYYILFRHKWKIVLCALLGFAGAYAMYRWNPPPFRSEAKLFVRYVLSEKQISAVVSDSLAKSPDQRGETIMNSEVEILTSTDLARQVAEAVGPEKILAANFGGKDPNLAAAVIKANLAVDVPPRSTVIHLTFRHPSGEVVQPVLRELIDRYLKLHREIHQSVGILGDFLTQETDQLRARLAQTEDDLRKARSKAGVVSSVEDTKKAYTDQIAALRLQLFNAQADLAERTSAIEETINQQKGMAASTPATETAATSPTSAIVAEYQNTVARIDSMTKAEADLLLHFTPESDRAKEIHTQLAAAEEHRRDLEKQHPSLAHSTPMAVATAAATTARSAQANVLSGAADIAALKARIKTLSAELDQLAADAARIDEVEVSISELRRTKDLEEANYRHFSETLEQSRLDEALGNGRVSNITAIENPTPPIVDWGNSYKQLAGLAAFGFGIGLVWAFAIELYLDRTIKRPIDIERHSPLPLFLTLPNVKDFSKTRPAWQRLLGRTNGSTPATKATAVSLNNGPDVTGPLQPFHETLRDRLIAYFESKNLTHKPKLVAITSVGRKAGVTTVAGGLAQSLSTIGEGNVLLVDMTVTKGSVRQFVKGESASRLDELLDGSDGALVQEKLYVVAADSGSERLSQNLPQRFTKLAPKLKASDFDYIIFDMPPVSQISITPRLATFMDMVLLVVESEKTDRDVVQRATNMLASSRTHIGAILNKTRTYGPVATHQEAFFAS